MIKNNLFSSVIMVAHGISLNNLTLTYERHPAVHHLSGFFPTGSMTAIIGPNGGGKSTLLKALAGLHPIDEGFIQRDPHLNLKKTAYLPQNSHWDRQFPITVFDLVSQALITEPTFWFRFNQNQKTRIQEALEQVKLWNQRNVSIAHLSLGQFQRVLFARAILQNANLILLDEPLTGLDEASIQDFFTLVQEWKNQGKTLIVVLHDRTLISKYFETTLILAKEAVAWGSTEQVLNPQYYSPSHLKKPFSFSEEECLR